MCALSVGVGGLCPHRGCHGPHLHGGPPVRSATPPRLDTPAPHTPPPSTSLTLQPTTSATTTDDAAQKATVCAFLVLNPNDKAEKCEETRRTSESTPQFHKVFTRQAHRHDSRTRHIPHPCSPKPPDRHCCPIRATIAKTAFRSRVRDAFASRDAPPRHRHLHR